MNTPIQQIRIVGKIALITATSDFNPLQNFAPLTVKLIGMEFCGVVLIDLLALNGLSDNRFVSIEFDGQKFNKSSLALESQINPSVKKQQDSLLRKNTDFLYSSVLSTREIERFLH